MHSRGCRRQPKSELDDAKPPSALFYTRPTELSTYLLTSSSSANRTWSCAPSYQQPGLVRAPGVRRVCGREGRVSVGAGDDGARRVWVAYLRLGARSRSERAGLFGGEGGRDERCVDATDGFCPRSCSTTRQLCIASFTVILTVMCLCSQAKETTTRLTCQKKKKKSRKKHALCAASLADDNQTENPSPSCPAFYHKLMRTRCP